MIRLADPVGQNARVAAAIEARVLAVLRSGRWIGGEQVAEAEQIAAGLFDRRAAVGVNSGTDALMLALQAVGVRPGDDVIVPAVSFFATAEAVIAIGARPVFADVRDDGCLDPADAARVRTISTAAIVAVHLYGTLCEAPDLGVPVVDDAAQAVGGAPPRAIGALTAVSTYPTKVWGACGDGGFVLGDDEVLVDRVRRLANHGMGDPHDHHRVDGAIARNSRLDAVQAAALCASAADLPLRLARRRAIAAAYDAQLSVRIVPRDAGSPVHVYAIRSPDRDRVRAALLARGVEAGVYYPRPMHLQPAIGGVAGTCPVAEALCAEVLALPVHAGLSDADVDAVIAAVREIGA